MKYIITENRLRKVQFKSLNYLFENMYEVKSEYYRNSRFWKKDNEVVLELNKMGHLLVSNIIWDNIEDMFSLDYRETQELIKEWAEQHLNLEMVMAIYFSF